MNFLSARLLVKFRHTLFRMWNLNWLICEVFTRSVQDKETCEGS